MMLHCPGVNHELTGLLQCDCEGTSVFGSMRSNLDRASSSICFRCCSKGKSPYVKNLERKHATSNYTDVIKKKKLTSACFKCERVTAEQNALLFFCRLSKCVCVFLYLALLGW